MKADKRTERGVMDTMEQLRQAYMQRNLDAALSCFMPDGEQVMYGTGADEKRIGMKGIEEQVRRDWAQSDSTAFDVGWHSVSAAGPVAWLAADVAFKGSAGGQEFEMPARLTAVFEQRDGRWLMSQAHFSAPMVGQEVGESFPD
jgi:uncharacterized protein (TIGR02246 family)